MFKGANRNYILLVLLFVLLVWAEYSTPKPVDWRRTYSRSDKIPFGCNALFRLMDEDMYKGKMERQKQTPFNVLMKGTEKKAAYVFINSNLSFSKLDTRYLMQFAEEGNDVFFAANSFWNNAIADTFNIRSYSAYYGLYGDTAKGYRFNFTNPGLRSKTPYTYKKGFEGYTFDSFDTSKVTVLATCNDTSAVFLRAPWGAGNFYFLTVPDIYTNYFVVNNPNREFAYKTLSYINAEQVWWDEYYKDKGIDRGNPLQFIFANDSLYAAYLLTLISLIIFMIFAMKRRQRAIAVVEPLPNTTLQFVEVVGSVYYNSRNHKIIAEEKINSFYEFLRAKFLVNSRKMDEETFLRISKLSTIPLSDVKKLFLVIGTVTIQPSITEQELVELNTVIENFYKQNKR
ncbi:MAG TPA: DUF4350 domain-containing protein [Bacteroidia bacterium]|nr:DUF4350 domain-containing protein [Bacteroidia bacterium]